MEFSTRPVCMPGGLFSCTENCIATDVLHLLHTHFPRCRIVQEIYGKVKNGKIFQEYKKVIYSQKETRELKKTG